VDPNGRTNSSRQTGVCGVGPNRWERAGGLRAVNNIYTFNIFFFKYFLPATVFKPWLPESLFQNSRI
jgi:hypothetical protein